MSEGHDELFTWNPEVTGAAEEVSTLLVTVTSFADVGHVQNNLTTALLAELPHHELGEFDLDELIDHRDSRGPIVFDNDHFEGYRRPRLVLWEVTDENGQHFLLLDGPEPALRWEALVRRVVDLVEDLGVRLSVVTDSIPMAAPHTRPIRVSRWASRPELILGDQPPFGKFQMPASFPSVLSQRLAETGHDYVGLAAHVPHYLADMDYPDAARAMVEAIHQVTGLALPTHALAVAAGAIRAELAAQVEKSEELSQMLQALEQQYDAATDQRAIETHKVDLPSAEAIGAEVEDFLRSIDSPTTDNSGLVPDPRTLTDPAGASAAQDTSDDVSGDRRARRGARSADDEPDDDQPYRPRRGDDSR
ncbi:PAC2 family protein [Acidipropionibacterium timonense]|uniref:PAC2 family protein n=1 Tax=Acidipropionibacterium timonense TaxID=2161818 RepID=UPI00102F3E3E|nr:PAC2 family protein [Acidipropionibacterium timonense]